MLLISSILITFGNKYLIILIGYIFYQPAFLFKKMDNVVLENNLRYLKKEDNYLKMSNKSKVIYSIITMIIALIAGPIFAINSYLPMYFCICICIINVLLSFCIFDINEEIKTNKNCKEDKKEKIKFSNPKLIFIILASFGLIYSAISVGQDNSKLLIQYNLEKYFNIGLTATYLSVIIVISRISRIAGNLIFKKIYSKMKDKVNVFLSILLAIAFLCILIGNCIEASSIIKITIMATGFSLILGIRDSIEVYTTNLILKNTEIIEQPKAISYLQLSRRAVSTAMYFIFSMILTQVELIYVIICLFIFAIIGISINVKLYKMIKE